MKMSKNIKSLTFLGIGIPRPIYGAEPVCCAMRTFGDRPVMSRQSVGDNLKKLRDAAKKDNILFKRCARKVEHLSYIYRRSVDNLSPQQIPKLSQEERFNNTISFYKQKQRAEFIFNARNLKKQQTLDNNKRKAIELLKNKRKATPTIPTNNNKHTESNKCGAASTHRLIATMKQMNVEKNIQQLEKGAFQYTPTRSQVYPEARPSNQNIHRNIKPTTVIEIAEEPASLNSQDPSCISRNSNEMMSKYDRRRLKNRHYKRKSRSKADVRNREKSRDRLAKRSARKKSQLVKQDTRVKETANKNGKDKGSFNNFIKCKANGPTYTCSCCGGLFFRDGVRILNRAKHGDNQIIQAYFDRSLSIYGCLSCVASASRNQIPRLALSRGFAFNDIPEQLNKLTDFEALFITPRFPFMRITNVGIDRQYKLKGSVVNVPINVSALPAALPLQMEQIPLVHVNFKRKLAFDHAHFTETVRPNLINDAAKWSCKQDIYKEYDIRYEMFKNFPQPVQNIANMPIVEDTEELNPGIQDTILLGENELQNIVVNVAPGEGQQPIPLFLDPDAEILSFPKIYGCKRITKARYERYSERIKSEVRMFDRRACSIPKLFFNYVKLEIERLRSSAQIALKKKKGVTIRAGEIKAGMINNLIQHDDAYKILATMRCSPAFWEQKKKELLAMVRQLGQPTLFVTFSAAESKWKELIKILYLVLQKKELSDESYAKLTYQEKAELIRRDPVTCSRYFDYRFRKFMKKVILSEACPLGKVSDYYYRVEFQHRGSPHIHMFLWIENAPNIVHDTEEKVMKYIDNIITTAKEESEFASYQIHKHSSSCTRMIKNRKLCRFEFPKYPSRTTMLLSPLTDNDTATKDALTRIHTTLRKAKLDDMTFEDFLKAVDLTEENYIRTIRSSIKKEKILLARKPKDIKVNCYNKTLLDLWQGNIDIQYIISPYECIQYVLNYIQKGSRGMSNLMKEIVEKSRKEQVTFAEQYKNIINCFVNNNEIGAQEVVYHLLSMPVSVSSRGHIFINTSHPTERVRLMKSTEEIEQLEDDSLDIMVDGLIEHYSKRDESLETVTLAEFAAYYYGHKKRRTLPKIIRYRRYDKKTDRSNYIREQFMLFTAWRDEKSLLNVDDEKYIIEKENITKIKHKLYLETKSSKNIDKAITDIMQNNEEIETSQESLATQRENQYKYYDVCTKETDIFQDCDENSSNIYRMPERICEIEYSDLQSKMNDKQHKYIENIDKFLDRDEPFYHFITGGAGVGKSLLIKCLYQKLIRRFDDRPGADHTKPSVLLTAFTGKAAYNIGGMTLHGAFHLPVNQCKYTSKIGDAQANTFRNKLARLKIIIIDEISMIGANLFKHLDDRLRQIFNEPSNIFGGQSIIVLGDFNQLPPVGDSMIFHVPKNAEVENIIGPFRWRKFKIFELTEIMRQKDDFLFAQALNNFANNKLTSSDMEILRKCVKNPPFPDTAIHLFSRNEEVDNLNELVMNQCSGEEMISQANDRCTEKDFDLRKQILQVAKTLRRDKTYGLPQSLRLKIGMRYMITVNTDVEDGLVNGVTGILKKFDHAGRLYFEFDKEIGRKNRKKYKNSHVIIMKITRKFQIGKSSALIEVIREQYPLTPCAALTIHKSQGDTYENVVVHMERGIRTTKLLYVAMSRAKSSNGLFLVARQNFKLPKYNTHDPAIKEIERMRTEALLEPEMTLIETPGHTLKQSDVLEPMNEASDKAGIMCKNNTNNDITLQGNSEFLGIAKVPVDIKEQIDFFRSIEPLRQQILGGKYRKPIKPYLRAHFEPIDNSGGGNCFYNSVSILLCGDERYAGELRDLNARFLKMYRNTPIADFIGCARFDEVINRIATPREWAEIDDILGLVLVLNRPIYIWNKEGSGAQLVEVRLSDEQAGRYPITLWCDTETHYISLVAKTSTIPKDYDRTESSLITEALLPLNLNIL